MTLRDKRVLGKGKVPTPLFKDIEWSNWNSHKKPEEKKNPLFLSVLNNI